MTNPPQGSDEQDHGPGTQQQGYPHGQPAQPYGQPGWANQYGQPYGAPVRPYGAPPPPYGQPYGVPAQKSHVGLIAGLTALALLVIAGVVVLVMALQSTVLDRSAVERDVATQFEEREGVAVDLTCPARMEVNSNSSYECTGTTADGEQVTLQITITDEDSAAYTWTES
jgi:hypothetical protein